MRRLGGFLFVSYLVGASDGFDFHVPGPSSRDSGATPPRRSLFTADASEKR